MEQFPTMKAKRLLAVGLAEDEARKLL